MARALLGYVGSSNEQALRLEIVRLRRLVAELEGQIAELCRDLAVEGKRIRQLQEQADELRRVIRQWAGAGDARSDGDTG